MTPEVRAELQRIGAELDGHRQVRVKTGGIVTPDTTPNVETKETANVERQAKARSAAGSRTGAASRQGSAGRSRSPGPAAHVRRDDLRACYEAQVVELQQAYPSAQVVASDAQGMWLRVESAVLDGIDRSVTFLVAVPYTRGSHPRAWAFWNLPAGPQWIGRRHTNFPDGSVCAYVPQSGTWAEGGRLDSLIDLYSVWALRQLHLEVFGRWPGRQDSSHPFYSLVEFKDDELCSCEAHDPPLRYGQCCKPEHLRRGFMQLKADFERTQRVRITDRNPPPSVIEYVEGRGDLPAISQVVSALPRGAAART